MANTYSFHVLNSVWFNLTKTILQLCSLYKESYLSNVSTTLEYLLYLLNTYKDFLTTKI